MNASAVIVTVAIVFAATVAGGLVAIVGLVAELIHHLRKLSRKEKNS